MTLQAAASAWGVGHAHSRTVVAQIEEVRHGVLAPSSDEHGHTHEDGEPAERAPGHLHGHNAFDHSHETPSVISSFDAISLIVPQERNPDLGFSTRNGPPDPIDRPPKNT